VLTDCNRRRRRTQKEQQQQDGDEIPPRIQSKYQTFGQRMKLNIYLHT
jgi:hypothetical protein